MKAAQFRDFGGAIEIVELPDPRPPDGGVVIGVKAAGLCRSDWHGWQGHDPDIRTLPHVPGHEFSGEIVALGAGLEGWRTGERVTAPFVCGCGRCKQCASGNTQVCPDQFQPGFTGPGAFAEFVALPFAETNLVRLPDAVDFAAAASLGCRFATAWRALAHGDQAAVEAGERVAIFGCGGVGLSAVMIAAALGAEVIAVDIRSEARARAVEFGASTALHPDEVGDIEANVTVDAVGNAAACRSAIHCLAPRGRHVQIGLLVAADADPALPMGRVIARELKLIGSHGMGAASYPGMLGRVADGSLRPERLMAASIGIDDLPAALRKLGEFGGEPGITVVDQF